MRALKAGIDEGIVMESHPRRPRVRSRLHAHARAADDSRVAVGGGKTGVLMYPTHRPPRPRRERGGVQRSPASAHTYIHTDRQTDRAHVARLARTPSSSPAVRRAATASSAPSPPSSSPSPSPRRRFRAPVAPSRPPAASAVPVPPASVSYRILFYQILHTVR